MLEKRTYYNIFSFILISLFIFCFAESYLRADTQSELAKETYTHLCMATYYKNTKRFGEAKKELEKALESFENSEFLHAEMAELSIFLHDIRTAEAEAKRAIELNPKAHVPYFLLGEIYQIRDKKEQAKQYFYKAAQLKPDNIKAQYYLAYVAKKLNDYETAAEAYKKLIEIDTYNPQFHYFLGEAYLKLGDKSKAREEFETTVKLDSNNKMAYKELGSLYIETNQLSKAADAYKRVLDLSSEDSVVLRELLAQLYIDLDRYEDAIEQCNVILKLDSNSEDAHYWIAIAYDGKGNLEQAEEHLRKVIELNPKYYDAYNTLGYFYAENEIKLEEAIKLIKFALEAKPENGAYRDSLGWVYFKLGKIDEALSELQKAVKYLPNSVEAHEHLGDVYLKKGEVDKAISAWQKALEIDPDNNKIQEKITKYQVND